MHAPESHSGITGTVTVDLAEIAGNWKSLARLVAPAKCGAVVKADAYGLGAARVIPALVRAGCKIFFIATPGEAEEARSRAPNAELYALDGLLPGAAYTQQTLNRLILHSNKQTAFNKHSIDSNSTQYKPTALNRH